MENEQNNKNRSCLSVPINWARRILEKTDTNVGK